MAGPWPLLRHITAYVPLYLVAGLVVAVGSVLRALIFWGSGAELYIPGFGYVSESPYSYLNTVSALAALSPLFALLSGFIHCHHQRTARDAGLTAGLMGLVGWAIVVTLPLAVLAALSLLASAGRGTYFAYSFFFVLLPNLPMAAASVLIGFFTGYHLHSMRYGAQLRGAQPGQQAGTIPTQYYGTPVPLPPPGGDPAAPTLGGEPSEVTTGTELPYPVRGPEPSLQSSEEPLP